MLQKNQPHRYAQRAIEAKTRQESCDKLSPETRLANLDRLFGVGQGAKRELP